MDHFEATSAGVLIIAGAAIMLVNIVRFRKTISIFNQSAPSKALRLHFLGNLHQMLMVIFLFGYLAVAYAIMGQVSIPSEFFVGAIFFLGSVFVWLGIVIQHHMIHMIRARYEEAWRAKADLEREQLRLEQINRQLTLEIAERQHAENELRDSEQRMKIILDKLPAGVLIIDEESKTIKDVNPAAQKIIGEPREKIVGSRCHRFVCPVEEGACPIIDAGMDMDRSERMLIRAGGEEIPILKTVCRINLDGRRHLLESFIDLSDKENLEARLQRAQKMEALGTLAGGVAHDLNNILSGITSYPELLLHSLPQESQLRRPLETIKRSGEKATTIVQDMLTLARRGVEVREVLNLKKVIEDFFNSPELSHLKSYHPRVSFRFNAANDLLNIKGSPVHLFKTVMNLVSNGAEAMPSGGSLTVAVENRHVDLPLRAYDTVKEGDYVMLSVSDTGHGIADEDRQRIFEPFYTKKKMGRSGTGLGMAVVYGTVKDHMGCIDVASEIDRGTTVTVYFPATRQQIVEDRTADDTKDFQIGRDFQGSGESILIVDDVAEQRQIATDILAVLNYKIHAVASGEEAVGYVRNNYVDLVVLDMIMDPGMNGLEAYQEILKFRPTQRAILVSGYSETDDVRRALELGATERSSRAQASESKNHMD